MPLLSVCRCLILLIGDPQSYTISCVTRKNVAFLSMAAAGAAVVCVALLIAVGSGRAAPVAAPDPPVRVIVDTDAGADDLIAIAFLLSRRDVRVAGITVANGVAHVQRGAQNILRVLALAGHPEIPVYAGRERPLSGSAEFPAAWRESADTLPGVTLPQPRARLQTEIAARFLARRFMDPGQRVRVLALGPLTNIADALDLLGVSAKGASAMVIMGGALGVPGNLSDGGPPPNGNTTAEWNMFVDPVAAARVLSFHWNAAASASSRNSRAIPIRLVALDATSQVPIDSAFLGRVEREARTPLGRMVAQVLATNRDLIAQGGYFAWDPLAAVALVQPEILRTRCVAVGVVEEPHDAGRTVELGGRPPNACVAVGADAPAFYRIFLDALETRAPR